MNKYEKVNNVSRKERVAIANRYAAIKKNRLDNLQKLAEQADQEIRYRTDRRFKHNRPKLVASPALLEKAIEHYRKNGGGAV